MFFTLAASFVLLGIILYGIIPGIVNYAGKFEIFFVNSLGLPFNVGTVLYFLLIIGVIISMTGNFFYALIYIGLTALVGVIAYVFIIGDIKRIVLK